MSEILIPLVPVHSIGGDQIVAFLSRVILFPPECIEGQVGRERHHDHAWQPLGLAKC